MLSVQKIPFNALTEASRVRLLASIDGQGPQTLLHERRDPNTAALGWILLMGAAGVGLMFLAEANFGAGWRGDALQPIYYVFGYLALAWLVAYSLLRAVRRILLPRRSPVPAGRFVFPLDIVDTTGRDLMVYPMACLTNLSAVHQHKNGMYTHTEFKFEFEGGHSVQFTVNGKGRAQQTLDDFNAAQRAARVASQARDVRALADLDAFAESRVNWHTLADAPARQPKSGPQVWPIPEFWWKPGLVALGLGAALGLPAYVVRNIWSDNVWFASLKERLEPYECEEYLEVGWLHTEEVRTVILPEAEFHEVEQKQSVGALREFIQSHPDPKFQERARTAIHVLYANALTSFRAEASTDDPRTVPFMEALLKWGEEHDNPNLTVRYLPPATDALTEMDKTLARGGNQFDGRTMVPVAPHFEGKKSDSRESRITEYLSDGFAKVFSNEVLSVVGGGHATAEQLKEPVDRPTIDIAYAVEPTGAVYYTDDDPRGFVGISVAFFVVMRVPGTDTPLTFDLTVEPPSEFTVEPSRLGADDSMADATVYDVMALRAYDRVAERLRTTFFHPDAAPEDPSEGTAGAGEGAAEATAGAAGQ